MIQFFTRDEDELKAYEVFEDLVAPFRLALAGYYNNIGVEPSIGNGFKELNVVPLSNVVQPELFSHVYGFLISMIEMWGVESLLDFMISVYGIPINIQVNPPMCINLMADISPDNVKEEYWVANNKTPVIKLQDTDYIIGKVDGANYYMLFKRLLGDILSIEQLRMLLQHLRPAGEYWKVSYRS